MKHVNSFVNFHKTNEAIANDDWVDLSNRIYDFVNKYACISPNYDEADDESDKYTSPDAYEMLACANLLKNGIKPHKCWSEWGSGGYKPYTSKEGKAEHDKLLSEINTIIKQK